MINLPEAKVLADSKNALGERAVTFELKFWRGILNEFGPYNFRAWTYQSLAIMPMSNLILDVEKTPWGPSKWGINGKGKEPIREMKPDEVEKAEKAWKTASKYASLMARTLQKISTSKGITNKLLEPFLCVPVIVTGTEWDAFFAHVLADSSKVEASVKDLALVMKAAYDASKPVELEAGAYHLPTITSKDITVIKAYCDSREISYKKEGQEIAKERAIARISRISGPTYGRESSVEGDRALFKTLLEKNMYNPFAHVLKNGEEGFYCDTAFPYFSN